MTTTAQKRVLAALRQTLHTVDVVARIRTRDGLEADDAHMVAAFDGENWDGISEPTDTGVFGGGSAGIFHDDRPEAPPPEPLDYHEVHMQALRAAVEAATMLLDLAEDVVVCGTVDAAATARAVAVAAGVEGIGSTSDTDDNETL